MFIDPDGSGPQAGVGGMVQTSAPRALETDEIAAIVADYARATANALQAGFDGVEIHAANGYLINQFIDSQSNARTDGYGGTLQGRLRFLREVTAAVIGVAGADRVGVRLAPLTSLNGTVDDTPQATYLAAAKVLAELDVAYLHIAEVDWADAPQMPLAFKQAIRLIFPNTLIYAGLYDAAKAHAALDAGWADLIGMGRAFIANPDLPHRLQHGLPLNPLDSATLFGGGAQGYTDYPSAG